jgi:GNAT superfamily N-acetyltransferase
MIKIEKATYRDVNQIQDLMYPIYFNESAYSDFEYDPVRTRMTITTWLSGLCFVAKDKNKIAGVFSMYFAQTFYKHLETDVEMFFVHPDYRGTQVARLLVDEMVRQSDMAGSKIIYTACASGINEKNNKLYTNLFKKFGFKELGTEVMRVSNE